MSTSTHTAEKTTASILSGVSTKWKCADAVCDLAEQIYQPEAALTAVFASSNYDLEELGPLLRDAFPQGALIGCTTAGEITPLGYRDNSLTGFSLSGRVAATRTFDIDCLADIHPETLKSLRQESQDFLEKHTTDQPGSSTFALFFIDGMSGAEEQTVVLVSRALGDIPLTGGSAGDNLRFGQTQVLIDGRFISKAASITLINTRLPFEIIKTQHFIPTDTRMVITEADQATRTVREINGCPAAEEYARLIGQSVERLTPDIFSQYPVMLKIGGEYFVRSIQKKNPDGSLTFYCAIDNGLVLSLGRSGNLLDNLQERLAAAAARLGQSQLLISFECVLRKLEVYKNLLVHPMSDLLTSYNAIGFHSYGEQINSVHVNQTFTGVMLGGINEHA